MEAFNEYISDLKQIPDIANYPLPKALYKELDIPLPTIPTLREYLASYQTAIFHPSTEPGETRPPAEGGIRIMPEPEQPKQDCPPASNVLVLPHEES